MRHRRRGRKLGRSPSHQRALLRNLASALFLTHRDAEFDENAPKVKGRIVTTIAKAKEVRPLVEKCITISRKSLVAAEAAEQFESDAERNTDAWRTWRNSEDWRRWAEARAPVVAARRRLIQLLGDKQAVEVLCEEVAPLFRDRDGGYTRILRLAKPRLGDAGTRAILEFVGENDRVKQVSTQKPSFDEQDDEEQDDLAPESAAEESSTDDGASATEGETAESSDAAEQAADESGAEDKEKK